MPQTELTDNTSFENMNEEDRNLNEKKKMWEFLVYLYWQYEITLHKQDLGKKLENIENVFKSEIRPLAQRHKKPEKTYYSFSLASRASAVLQKRLDEVPTSEKDATFQLVRQKLEAVQKTAEKLEKAEHPLTDKECNAFRENLTDLSKNCNRFISPSADGKEKSEKGKAIVKQIKNFADEEKKKICKAQADEIDDLTTKMKSLCNAMQKVHLIGMFLEQAGIKKTQPEAPVTDTVSPKQLATQLDTLIAVAKLAEKYKEADLHSKAEENTAAVLQYLQAHPDVLKQSGITKEKIAEAKQTLGKAKELTVHI